jgi:uncharacterized protein (DUF433 family)
MKQTEAAEWLSVPEAAAFLGCSDVWVQKMLRRGLLEGRKISGRAWIVSRKSAVENAEEARTRNRSMPGRKREGIPGAARVPKFDRISHDPNVHRGEPCIKGTRLRVAAIVALVDRGVTEAEVLELHPDLQAEDVRQAVRYSRA